MDAGTVNPPLPAVVMQVNVVSSTVEFGKLPVFVKDWPLITTRSDALPPVQLRVRPALRVMEEGIPPVTTRGGPRVSDALNCPTSLPPAPFNVYLPATIPFLLVASGVLIAAP